MGKKQQTEIIPITRNNSVHKKNYIENKLDKINESKKIKIRAHKRKNKYSLFLDYSTKKGRERPLLKIFVTNRKTKENEENIKKAIIIRDKKEIELFGISDLDKFELSKSKLKINFISFFEDIVIKKNNAKPWKHTLNHLKIFSKNTPVTFAQITKKYCENFKLYLEKNLSQNSAHTYFARFKNALNIAVQDDILDTNPAQFITVKKEKVSRQFLDEQEIKRLIATPCFSKQTKNAFLFSCFTGLRISDIRQLKWKDVDNNFLYIKQIKTNEPFRMKLSQAALDILKLQKNNTTKNTDYVFTLLKSDNNINRQVKDWITKAGINKDITYHSSRHTFATLLLSSGVDIYTVSKYLGHQDVKVTQIYAKLIDKKKDEAIDKLPQFDLAHI